MRLVRRWRLLLAHDATASTCDPLLDAIEGALGNVDASESSSVDDARLALRKERFDLCMVCLDLPPAPLGGVRLAEEIVRERLPVVLITRSLRWVPPSAALLRDLPWVPPDAGITDVSRAVADAVATFGPASSPLRAEAAPPTMGPWLARTEDSAGRRARRVGGL